MPTASSPLGRPVGAKGEETRERIIAATMRCVAEVGYSRATIREIARGARMTSGSLYHYFPNKAELVKATFLEIAELALPRLAAAADRTDDVLDTFMAVLDEGDRLMRDYPHAVAFDRALRVESPEHLHLAEDSDTIFNALRAVITGIVDQARREGVLTAGTDVDSAANAIYAVMYGLYEHAATAPPDDYHATVGALKKLIRGTLFTPREPIRPPRPELTRHRGRTPFSPPRPGPRTRHGARVLRIVAPPGPRLVSAG
ncbi:TetR/AcrR family transcriptional regulator [Yinghuangia sp. ASG 101]|uniref:TetR/AcrR family transcriptional regulator n=1 Tax=Yinghuangia sp. ASG 101 TaxID=2896848 RepID=UPI001E5A86B9|nr:TetR/AcrR family transcriptional regulator [Yinghuangia sp. ASG 101]UGQ09696.1 TetR/AcrR family transcriptional regulator [Yinghuangia sp. ASG 101]